MYLSLHQDSEIQNLIKSSDNETYISHHDCKFICYRNNCHNTIRSGLEHIVICGTQIMTTVIVTPLGVFAIAANSFAITAESLCICPVWDCRCCTTLVGRVSVPIAGNWSEVSPALPYLYGMTVMGL